MTSVHGYDRTPFLRPSQPPSLAKQQAANASQGLAQLLWSAVPPSERSAGITQLVPLLSRNVSYRLTVSNDDPVLRLIRSELPKLMQNDRISVGVRAQIRTAVLSYMMQNYTRAHDGAYPFLLIHFLEFLRTQALFSSTPPEVDAAGDDRMSVDAESGDEGSVASSRSSATISPETTLSPDKQLADANFKRTISRLIQESPTPGSPLFSPVSRNGEPVAFLLSGMDSDQVGQIDSSMADIFKMLSRDENLARNINPDLYGDDFLAAMAMEIGRVSQYIDDQKTIFDPDRHDLPREHSFSEPISVPLHPPAKKPNSPEEKTALANQQAADHYLAKLREKIKLIIKSEKTKVEGWLAQLPPADDPDPEDGDDDSVSRSSSYSSDSGSTDMPQIGARLIREMHQEIVDHREGKAAEKERKLMSLQDQEATIRTQGEKLQQATEQAEHLARETQSVRQQNAEMATEIEYYKRQMQQGQEIEHAHQDTISDLREKIQTQHDEMATEIERLRAENARIQAESDAKLAAAAEQEARAGQLATDATGQTAEAQALVAQVRQKDAELDEREHRLTAETESIQQDRLRLEVERTQFVEQQQRLQTGLEELDSDRQQFAHERAQALADLKAQERSLRDRTAAFEAEMSAQRDAMTEERATKTVDAQHALRAVSAALAGDVPAAEDGDEAGEGSATPIAAEVAELVHQVRALREEKTSLEETVAQKREALAQEEEAATALQDRGKELDQREAALRTATESLAATMQQFDEQVSTFQSGVDQQSEKARELQEEQRRLDEFTTVLKRKTQEIAEERSALNTEKEASEARLASQVQGLEARRSSADEELRAVEAQKAAIGSEIEAAEATLGALRQEEATLKDTTLPALRADAEQMERSLADGEAELARRHEAAEVVRAEVSQTTEALTVLQAQHATLAGQVQALEAQRAGLTSGIADLEARLSSADEGLQAVEARRSEAETDLLRFTETAQRQKSELEQAVTALRQQHADATRSIEEQAQRKAAIDGEVGVAEATLGALQQEEATLKDTTLPALRADAEQMERSLADGRAELARGRTEAEVVRRETEQLTAQKDGLASEVADLEQRQAAAESAIANARRSTDAVVQESEAQLQALKTQKQTLTGEVERLEQEVKRIQELTAQTQLDAQTALSLTASERAAAIQAADQVAQLRADEAALKSQLASLRAEIDTSRSALAADREIFQTERRRFETEKAQFQEAQEQAERTATEAQIAQREAFDRRDTELQARQSELDQRSAALDAREAAVASQTAALSEADGRRKTELVALQDRIKQLEVENRDLGRRVKALDELHQKMREIGKNTVARGQALTALMMSNPDFAEMTNPDFSDIQRLKLKLIEFRTQLVLRDRELQDLERLRTEQGPLQQRLQELEAKTRTFDSQSAEIDVLKGRLRQLTETYARKEAALNLLHQQLLDETTEQLKRELALAQGNAERYKRSFEILGRPTNPNKSEIARLTQENEALSRRLASETHLLFDKLQQIQDRLHHLQSAEPTEGVSREAWGAEEAALRQQMAQQQLELETTGQRLTELTRRRDELQTQTAELQAEHDALDRLIPAFSIDQENLFPDAWADPSAPPPEQSLTARADALVRENLKLIATLRKLKLANREQESRLKGHPDLSTAAALSVADIADDGLPHAGDGAPPGDPRLADTPEPRSPLPSVVLPKIAAVPRTPIGNLAAAAASAESTGIFTPPGSPRDLAPGVTTPMTHMDQPRDGGGSSSSTPPPIPGLQDAMSTPLSLRSSPAGRAGNPSFSRVGPPSVTSRPEASPSARPATPGIAALLATRENQIVFLPNLYLTNLPHDINFPTLQGYIKRAIEDIKRALLTEHRRFLSDNAADITNRLIILLKEMTSRCSNSIAYHSVKNLIAGYIQKLSKTAMRDGLFTTNQEIITARHLLRALKDQEPRLNRINFRITPVPGSPVRETEFIPIIDPTILQFNPDLQRAIADLPR